MALTRQTTRVIGHKNLKIHKKFQQLIKTQREKIRMGISFKKEEKHIN